MEGTVPEAVSRRPIAARLNIALTDIVDEALRATKPFGDENDSRKWVVRSAVYEGILALAAFWETHGCMPGAFRFEVLAGHDRRETEVNSKADAIERVLAEATMGPLTSAAGVQRLMCARERLMSQRRMILSSADKQVRGYTRREKERIEALMLEIDRLGAEIAVAMGKIGTEASNAS